jgi:hypothetical protein
MVNQGRHFPVFHGPKVTGGTGSQLPLVCMLGGINGATPARASAYSGQSTCWKKALQTYRIQRKGTPIDRHSEARAEDLDVKELPVFVTSFRQGCPSNKGAGNCLGIYNQSFHMSPIHHCDLGASCYLDSGTLCVRFSLAGQGS